MTAVKRVSFSVWANDAQALRWNRAAQAEGHRAAGTWLALAADRHLEAVRRAGKPIPLGWRRGRFDVTLATGERLNVNGMVSHPFAYYRGDDDRRDNRSCFFTLVHLPGSKVVATLRSSGQCRSLAAELVAAILRDELPDAGQVVGRHVRESV